MEKRNIEVDINTAKKWYSSNNNTLKELALSIFTRKELSDCLPRSWEEYIEQNPYEEGLIIPELYYDNRLQGIDKIDISENVHRNVRHITFLNMNQLEANNTFIKLIRLRDVYRQGWKPNWKDKSSKYCLGINFNFKIEILEYTTIVYIFSFQTEELAEQFLENFKEELEQLKELL